MVHPDNGEEVGNQEIQKGFEVEPGKFVIVTDEDLKSLEPEPSREIEIGEFVPPEKISQRNKLNLAMLSESRAKSVIKAM